ncbi:MAG: chorismate synthase [Streptosporangiales bacterium]|nr:chorismate synthase [Streptosporangiales bacterium]
MQVERVEEPARLAAAVELLAEIWATPPGCPPLPADVLRSLGHGGGAVHVAFRAGTPIGAAAAFFGPPAARSVYSLIAGAHSSDRGIGVALKQAQRVWALQHDATVMLWTFDPLVSRNARFNLVKLGAMAREYSVDFYGPLDDGLNSEDETDRLTAEWTLTDVRPQQPTDTPAPPDPATADVTATAPDGGPLAIRVPDALWCRVPHDIVALRQDDPGAAAGWRAAVRDVFVPAFAAGFRATGMTRDGWYHLTTEEAG